jgi:hypothetical protein
MRVINFLLAIIFMTLAFRQTNVGYPAIWIMIYGAMAVLAIMAVFEFYLGPMMALVWVGWAICSFLLVDEANEWIGLILSATVLSVYTFRWYRKRRGL